MWTWTWWPWGTSRVGLRPGKTGPAVAPATMLHFTGKRASAITQGHHAHPDRGSGAPNLALVDRLRLEADPLADYLFGAGQLAGRAPEHPCSELAVSGGRFV